MWCGGIIDRQVSVNAVAVMTLTPEWLAEPQSNHATDPSLPMVFLFLTPRAIIKAITARV